MHKYCGWRMLDVGCRIADVKCRIVDGGLRMFDLCKITEFTR
jgi:hypothetical protein